MTFLYLWLLKDEDNPNIFADVAVKIYHEKIISFKGQEPQNAKSHKRPTKNETITCKAKRH